jgi:hypothetical protein
MHEALIARRDGRAGSGARPRSPLPRHRRQARCRPTRAHFSARALYNLACLDVRAGREDDAADALAEALRLRPALVEQARDDPDLAALRR